MAKNKILTITDIVEAQSKMDKLTVKYYESKVLGGKIEIRKIPLKKFMSFGDMIAEDTIEGLGKLLLECCPMFKENAKQLKETYNVATAYEVPFAVLGDNLKEINEIGELISTFYGMDKVDETVKN